MAETKDVNQDIAKAFATIYETIKQVNSDYVARLEEFITSEEVTNYVSEKKAILEKYNLEDTERFCIFEEITDRWRHEDYLSDILKIILDPQTPKIGNIQFLKNFLKMIDVSEEDFPVDANTKIIVRRGTKEGIFDLLICNSDKKGIIIESKLNDATDQDNQLAKYIKIVCENEKYGMKHDDIVKVVYLLKRLDSTDNYDKALEKLKGKIENYDLQYNDEKNFLLKPGRLVVRAGITDPKQEPQSLVSFLDDCIEVVKDEKDQTAKVIIEQYKTLLQHIGGNIYMNTPNKELLKAIYSDSEKFETAVEFAEFWNNRAEVRGQLLKEMVLEKISRKPDEDRENGLILYWPFHPKNLQVALECNCGGEVVIGFYTLSEKRSFKKDDQTKLTEIIKSLQIKNFTFDEGSGREYIWGNIKDTPTLFADVIKGIELLLKYAEEYQPA